jgi:lipopolysaccharide assembly protein B
MQLLRGALLQAPNLILEELPHLLRLAGAECRDTLLQELVAQTTRDPEQLKRLVFAAIAAGLTDAPPLRAAIEQVFASDATLRVVSQSGRSGDANPLGGWADNAVASTDIERLAHEIGALLANAEKYRCNECGFAGRNFYWHCPACHSWDSFEPYAVVKLG